MYSTHTEARASFLVVLRHATNGRGGSLRGSHAYLQVMVQFMRPTRTSSSLRGPGHLLGAMSEDYFATNKSLIEDAVSAAIEGLYTT